MRENDKKREGCLAEKFEETAMAGSCGRKTTGVLAGPLSLSRINNRTYSISCQAIERSTLASPYFSMFYGNL